MENLSLSSFFDGGDLLWNCRFRQFRLHFRVDNCLCIHLYLTICTFNNQTSINELLHLAELLISSLLLGLIVSHLCLQLSNRGQSPLCVCSQLSLLSLLLLNLSLASSSFGDLFHQMAAYTPVDYMKK